LLLVLLPNDFIGGIAIILDALGITGPEEVMVLSSCVNIKVSDVRLAESNPASPALSGATVALPRVIDAGLMGDIVRLLGVVCSLPPSDPSDALPALVTKLLEGEKKR